MTAFKCELCGRTTRKIFETERSEFYQCNTVHATKLENGKESKIVNPVFMLKKEVHI
jgi:ribosome-binding protein aMBF1 (putative translation factor)